MHHKNLNTIGIKTLGSFQHPTTINKIISPCSVPPVAVGIIGIHSKKCKIQLKYSVSSISIIHAIEWLAERDRKGAKEQMPSHNIELK